MRYQKNLKNQQRKKNCTDFQRSVFSVVFDAYVSIVLGYPNNCWRRIRKFCGCGTVAFSVRLEPNNGELGPYDPLRNLEIIGEFQRLFFWLKKTLGISRLVV